MKCRFAHSALAPQATQETVWHPPEGAFVPLPLEALMWAQSLQQQAAVPNEHSSTPDAPAEPSEEAPRGEPLHLGGRTQHPSGVHTRFEGAEFPPEPADPSEAAAPSEAAPPAGVEARYWAQRYRYFSRFDAGCCLDGDSWFSVTPEVVAMHQARRLGAHVALDAFGGCGGNSIALARCGAFCLCVELSRERCKLALANAAVYGVRPLVDCVQADWTSLGPAMAAAQRRREPRAPLADALFLSPPWGGPAYAQQASFSLHAPLVGGASAQQLLATALQIARRAALFLPRNTDAAEARQAAAASGAACAELEDGVLSGKVKAVTLYCAVEGPAARRSKRVQMKGHSSSRPLRHSQHAPRRLQQLDLPQGRAAK